MKLKDIASAKLPLQSTMREKLDASMLVTKERMLMNKLPKLVTRKWTYSAYLDQTGVDEIGEDFHSTYVGIDINASDFVTFSEGQFLTFQELSTSQDKATISRADVISYCVKHGIACGPFQTYLTFSGGRIESAMRKTMPFIEDVRFFVCETPYFYLGSVRIMRNLSGSQLLIVPIQGKTAHVERVYGIRLVKTGLVYTYAGFCLMFDSTPDISSKEFLNE